MIQAVGSSEPLVPVYQATGCHIPEDRNVDTAMLTMFDWYYNSAHHLNFFFFQISDLESGSISYMRQHRTRKHILIGSLAELISDLTRAETVNVVLPVQLCVYIVFHSNVPF